MSRAKTSCDRKKKENQPQFGIETNNTQNKTQLVWFPFCKLWISKIKQRQPENRKFWLKPSCPTYCFLLWIFSTNHYHHPFNLNTLPTFYVRYGKFSNNTTLAAIENKEQGNSPMILFVGFSKFVPLIVSVCNCGSKIEFWAFLWLVWYFKLFLWIYELEKHCIFDICNPWFGWWL